VRTSLGLAIPVNRAGLSLALLAVTFVVGCAAVVPRSDEEKLARIGEMVVALEDRFPDVETITVEEVGRLLEKDSVVLVDIREPREREISMIPGAITAEEFEAAPERYADVAVVAYCTIGHRSSEYAERLISEGYPVLNLSGSILSWTHAGGPLVGPDGTTRRLHVYGSNWDLAPAAYEADW